MLGWAGIVLLGAGVERLAWRRGSQVGVPRTLAMASAGLLGLATLAYFRSNSSRQMELHWHIWLVVAVGIVAGWRSLAAMRGQTVRFGWRGLAVFGALTACALPLWMAFIMGAGKLLRPFPAVWRWLLGEQMEGLGLRYLSLAAVVATFAYTGWRAWRWSQGKAELPGVRLAVWFSCLFVAWAYSAREMERNAYYPTPAYDSALLPETVRIFQTQQNAMGTQGASFSGRWEGQPPGWQLDAGWVALDGSGAGSAQRTSLTSNHFHFMFRWPTPFAASQQQPVRASRPGMLPPAQWLLQLGERQTVFTVTNAAGERLAGFIELLPETPPNPLGSAAVALHRVISRLPSGQPVPGRVGLSLTLAPRQVAAVQVFVRERDTLTPLPRLSALLVAPAGERIERQIHWEAAAIEPTADGQVPRVRMETGVAGHLSRLMESQLPAVLAENRLRPAAPEQPVALAPGVLREWVLFECPQISARGPYRRREIVARIASQPLAADWRPDLVQPHFRLGTNWVRLTQPDPVRASQRVRPMTPPVTPPVPRPPRNQISLAWTNVSVHPSGEVVAQGPLALSGGEKLLGRVRGTLGTTEPAYAWSSVHTLPFSVVQTAGVNWKFPASFTDTDKTEAAGQAWRALAPSASLTLLADQWQPLFTVTNGTGEVVTGEVMFSPALPREGPPEAVLHLLPPPFQVRNSPQLDLHFRSEAPVGYRLVTQLQRPPNSPGMTASTRTTFSGARVSEHAQWFLQGVLKPDMDKARAQVAASLEQSPLRLRPGDRREVFTFTTDRGETYTGAVELQTIP